MLVHQLRSEAPPLSEPENSAFKCLALEGSPSDDNNTSVDASPVDLMKASLNVKHCNSFNSDILETSKSDSSNNCDNDNIKINGETAISRIENKHSSVDDSDDVLDTKLSLEDKRRHQILTKLWTELKGSEVTPKKLLEALNAVDSALWVPPQRPVSLDLQIPILQTGKYKKTRPFLVQSSSKSEEETIGNESPESGNRDEGYSTMSSDVQAEVTRAPTDAVLQTCALEDLKEATDETDLASETRLLVTDNKDPDIFYIPLNLLNLKSR